MKGTKKLLVLKKSQIITMSLISILVIAGYLNYINTSPTKKEETAAVSTIEKETPPDTGEVKNYGEAKFVSAQTVTEKGKGDEIRYEKEKGRSEAIAVFKEISENKNATPEQKKEAKDNMLRIASNLEKETNIETVLSSFGYERVTVVIGTNDITVSVCANQLSSTELAKIRNTVINETGITSDKIKVSLVGKED